MRTIRLSRTSIVVPGTASKASRGLLGTGEKGRNVARVEMPEGTKMQRPLTVVMLAGRIRPSPLRAALDVPVLCLPVSTRGSLLDAWLAALAPLPNLNDVYVVVNSAAEAEAVNASFGGTFAHTTGDSHTHIMAEP